MDAERVQALLEFLEEQDSDYKWPGITGNLEGRRAFLKVLLKNGAISINTYTLGLLMTDITEGLNK